MQYNEALVPNFNSASYPVDRMKLTSCGHSVLVEGISTAYLVFADVFLGTETVYMSYNFLMQFAHVLSYPAPPHVSGLATLFLFFSSTGCSAFLLC
jgi:hypothetical protein